MLWGLVIGVSLWGMQRWLSELLDRHYTYRERIEKERTQQARYRQMLQRSALTETRQTGAAQRLATLIYVIMLVVEVN